MSASWQLLPRFRSPSGHKRGRVGVAATALVLGTLVTGPMSLGAAPVAAVSIAAPVGLSPNSDDGSPASQAALTDIQLTWAPVAGATSYEIAVSDSPGFDPSVLTGSSTTASWSVPASVPAGDYVWRVRAVVADGAGEWSGTAAFTRSWESSPANVRVLSSENVPTVAWDALPGASFYEVEFSDSPYDESTDVMQALDDDDRFTCFTQHPYIAPYGTASGKESLPGDEAACSFTALSEDPRYAAKQKAETACDKAYADATAALVATGGVVNNSALLQQRVTCYATALDTFTKTNPLSAKKFFPLKDENGKSLPWYVRVRGRNGTVTDTKTPFAAPAVDCTGVWASAGGNLDSTENRVTVPVPSAVPKYLAVPECSSWAPAASFFVTMSNWARDITTPVVGQEAQPNVGASFSTTPLLRWTDAGDVAKYRVYLGRTRDLRSSDHVWETTATSLLPYGTLPDARRLYWGVQACGYKSCGPISAASSFTKYATSPVSAASAVSTAVDLDLSWHTQTDLTRVDDTLPRTDSEARSYQVQLDPVGSGWAKPARDVLVDASRRLTDGPDISRTTLSLAELPDNTYVWRVRAIDESGFTYPWSVGKSFLRDVSIPTAAVSTASGFTQSAPLTVTFSEPVVDADIDVRLAGAATRVAGTVTGSGTTVWTFTPKTPWVTGQSYDVTVSGGRDPGGNLAAAAKTTLRSWTMADSASAAVSASGPRGTWVSLSASDAVGKSYLVTSGRARLSAVVVGRSLLVYACKGPKAGIATIVLDQKASATVDLYRAYSGCGIVWRNAGVSGRHTVTVVATGRKNARSAGTRVSLDAIRTR